MATRARPTKRASAKTPARGRLAAPRLDVDAITDRSVPGMFLRQVARLGGRAIVHHHAGGEWQPVSWKRMGELVLRVAAGLVGAGVQRGDRVILISENRLEWIY